MTCAPSIPLPASPGGARPRPRLTLAAERLKRTVRLGLRSLWLHRLRSLLTVLGIVFGVCSVIAMLAIGEGASFEAQEQIKNLGSQNIILRSVKPPEQQKVTDQGSQSYVLQYGLTYADIRAIQATIPGVIAVVPGRLMRDYVWNISRRVDCEILATIPSYPLMRNRRVLSGRFFTDKEMDEKANVCVLGAETAEKLFPLDPPLGSHVRVGGDYYHVIGVLEPLSQATGAATRESAKARAADGISNAPGTRTITMSSHRAPERTNPSYAPCNNRSVMNALNRDTTIPKRLPLASRLPDRLGNTSTGAPWSAPNCTRAPLGSLTRNPT